MNSNHKKFYIIIFIVLGMAFSLARASYAQTWKERTVCFAVTMPHTMETEKNSEDESIFPMIITDRVGNKFLITKETITDNTTMFYASENTNNDRSNYILKKQ